MPPRARSRAPVFRRARWRSIISHHDASGPEARISQRPRNADAKNDHARPCATPPSPSSLIPRSRSAPRRLADAPSRSVSACVRSGGAPSGPATMPQSAGFAPTSAFTPAPTPFQARLHFFGVRKRDRFRQLVRSSRRRPLSRIRGAAPEALLELPLPLPRSSLCRRGSLTSARVFFAPRARACAPSRSSRSARIFRGGCASVLAAEAGELRLCARDALRVRDRLTQLTDRARCLLASCSLPRGDLPRGELFACTRSVLAADTSAATVSRSCDRRAFCSSISSTSAPA